MIFDLGNFALTDYEALTLLAKIIALPRKTSIPLDLLNDLFCSTELLVAHLTLALVYKT